MLNVSARWFTLFLAMIPAGLPRPLGGATLDLDDFEFFPNDFLATGIFDVNRIGMFKK